VLLVTPQVFNNYNNIGTPMPTSYAVYRPLLKRVKRYRHAKCEPPESSLALGARTFEPKKAALHRRRDWVVTFLLPVVTFIVIRIGRWQDRENRGGGY
jgi:hypothetical protein